LCIITFFSLFILYLKFKGGGGGGDGGSGDGLSFGSILLIMYDSLFKYEIIIQLANIKVQISSFFTTLVTYFLGGFVFLKFVKKNSGKDLIPNYGFWTSIPGDVKVSISN
jgi:hypothetical protein